MNTAEQVSYFTEIANVASEYFGIPASSLIKRGVAANIVLERGAFCEILRRCGIPIVEIATIMKITEDGVRGRRSKASRMEGYTSAVERITSIAHKKVGLTDTDSETKEPIAPPEAPDCFRRQVDLITKWRECSLLLEEQINNMIYLLGVYLESPFISAIHKCQDNYTKLLAQEIGDKDGWLEWYKYDCDFGRKPMTMHFSDKEGLEVITAVDILTAIQSSPEGLRVHRYSSTSSNPLPNESIHIPENIPL